MSDKNYNQDFAERFNEVLDGHGIPPRNQGRIQVVSDMFLISHAGAGKWVNGVSSPAKARMKDIASRFNVSYEWLAFGSGEKSAEPKKNHEAGILRKFPILTFNEAPHYEKHLKDFVGQTVTLDIADASDDAFVMYSIGTAMSGRFPEGTMLVVDPNARPQDGDYVVASIAKLPEAIFRQMIFGESGKFLYAHDPRYQSHKLSSADTVIGKVMQARVQF